MTVKPDSERFQSGAEDYAAYLETPEGRLRSDLAFANLQDFLPLAGEKLVVCAGSRVRHGSDGGSPGATWHSRHAAGFLSGDAGYRETHSTGSRSYRKSRVATWGRGQLANLFQTRSFDVILCHNVLEFLDDPSAVLCGAARALRDSSAILSVLVRNRAGEVFKAAIQAGDLAAAENNLTAEWGQESLYGGRVRLFTPDSLQGMLKAASLAVIAERGVRVLADYLPPRVSRSADYERILELERKLGSRPEYCRSRALHAMLGAFALMVDG